MCTRCDEGAKKTRNCLIGVEFWAIVLVNTALDNGCAAKDAVECRMGCSAEDAELTVDALIDAHSQLIIGF